MFDISTELKNLPSSPGVYIMHDDKNEIMYVGKAINLKNRVKQYFQKTLNRNPMIEQMVKKIDHFEYIVTDSELEALILECNLIKEHHPKYNTLLMDDKTYPFIKVTVGEDFPRVLFSRSIKKDSAKYFGPYINVTAIREVIELARRIFFIRTCNKKLPNPNNKERECLNYHIGRCKAPCQGRISKEEYAENVKGLFDFLNGKYDELLKDLTQKMYQASEKMEYEKAGEYKELIEGIKSVSDKQKITAYDGEDRDVIAIATQDQDAVALVMFVRGGKMIGREHFFMKAAIDDSKEEILGNFVKQYYAGTPFIPKEIYLQSEIGDRELLEKWLTEKKGARVYISVPKKGLKAKLVETAHQNASLVLEKDKERIKREEGRTIGALKEISSLLGIDELNRIEAFDISNTSGVMSVGSMIVFEKGKPRPSDYRKFKIKTVVGPNDYASMEEVLTRRFTHEKRHESQATSEFDSFNRLPDIIMMDGGKGQVNIALKVLRELGLDIKVCGMVKDDNHNTRGLYYNNEELPIDKSSEGFKLITRIQDEAHRFAIEYHRSLRNKATIHSVLDEIEGIGDARRKALLKKFKSVENIANATVEELENTDKMNNRVAEYVYEFFHKDEENLKED